MEGLMLSVESGDRLHLIWLGESEDDSKYWLVETVPEIALPPLAPPISTITPSPVPLSTESTNIPPVYTPVPILKQQAFHQTETALAGYWTVTANASSVISTNSAIQQEKEINQQRCDQAAINNKNRILVDKWQEQRNQTVKEFVKKRLASLKDSVGKGTDNATHIYNSLYYAARTIRQEKDTNSFGDYYLIILSDMEEIGSQDGEDLTVDLSGVNVLMAMVSCNQSIECQNRSDHWTTYFRDHSAILPTYPFRLLDETTPYVIFDFLK